MVKRLEPVSPKAARKLSQNLASALTCFDITALPGETVLNTNLIERLNRAIRTVLT